MGQMTSILLKPRDLRQINCDSYLGQMAGQTTWGRAIFALTMCGY